MKIILREISLKKSFVKKNKTVIFAIIYVIMNRNAWKFLKKKPHIHVLNNVKGKGNGEINTT